jgi:heat shock protein HslJ
MGAGPLAAVVAATLLLGLSGCGGGSDDSPTASAGSETPASTPTTAVNSDSLAAATYPSTGVEGDGFVDGASIMMVFELDTMSVSAGCNTMFGSFEVADGMLRWSGVPAQTMKACPEDQSAQDQLLASLLTDGMSVSLGEGTMTLTSDDQTIELAEETTPPDLDALLGRTWTVVGTIADGATQRVPRRTRLPRLHVGADGVSRLETGCNTGRTVVQVEGDTLVFGPTTTTRRGCPQPDREIERRVLAVLDGPADGIDTQGEVLVLTKDDYGLVIRMS